METTFLEGLLAVMVGVCLSAACGFRVFVPLLVAGLAAHTGHVQVSESFQWIGEWPAITVFATATVIEVAAYYIPWVDNALDQLATPAAVVAGTLLTAAFLPDMSPLFRWALALIAGGGAAATVQAATVTTRNVSSLGTGGMANPIIASAELGGSFLTSLLAIAVPVLVVLLLVHFVAYALSRRARRRRGWRQRTHP